MADKVLIFMLILAFSADMAFGHDDAYWIKEGGYRDALGNLCCGPAECRQLAAGDVAVTRGGYLIRSTGETIPFSKATPTPAERGGYWRCRDAEGIVYKTKCFFAPFKSN